MVQTENLFTPGKIRTFTGRYVNPLEMTVDDIDIRDIAHALSMNCRWGGQCRRFYSVAQHCIDGIMRMPANQVLRRQFLLHDATEAYLLDLPKPVKDLLPAYKKAEAHLNRIICMKFGTSFVQYAQEVKEMDERMLQMEWEQLMLGSTDHGLHPMLPGLAESEFLKAYYSLFN